VDGSLPVYLPSKKKNLKEKKMKEEETITEESCQRLFDVWASAIFNGAPARARKAFSIARQIALSGQFPIETSWVAASLDYGTSIKMIKDYRPDYRLIECTLPVPSGKFMDIYVPTKEPVVLDEKFQINDGIGLGGSITIAPPNSDYGVLKIWHHREVGQEDTVAVIKDNGVEVGSGIREMFEFIRDVPNAA
jgi:hypothetical protein